MKTFVKILITFLISLPIFFAIDTMAFMLVDFAKSNDYSGIVILFLVLGLNLILIILMFIIMKKVDEEIDEVWS